MSLSIRGSRRLLACACTALALGGTARAETQLQEVTVTGTREGELKSETPAAVTVLGGDTVQEVKPAHPSELFARVPGAVVMQTNGEGHTTGIRQPIGTAPVYLYLEDGVPTRAPGFFNHNAMFEINLPQAGAVEVTRGPGSALQGSDAIGAVINVLTKAPSDKPETSITAEAGQFGWGRVLASHSDAWGDLGARGDLNLTHTDGWRDHTGYDRQSATVRADAAINAASTLKTVVSFTNASMETGAAARLTERDYETSPRLNYHSIAYRDVQAFRAQAAWEHEDGPTLVSLTPFVRWNHMDMLPSYNLGNDPDIEVTGHSSLGLQAKVRRDFEPWRTRLVGGADFDYSVGTHHEDRILPFKNGDFYTGYRNLGQIYDYDVTFGQASPYLHAETSPVAPLRLQGGLRVDTIAYDYHNNLATGSFTTNVNGTNKTFYRPGDDARWFTHLSPSLGATYEVDPAFNLFARYKHSFRTPAEASLFRQGANVDSIHLKPIKVDDYELGLRGPDKGPFSWELSWYRMIKRDDIISTKDGSATSQTNNGRTMHSGFEGAVGWQATPEWRIGANASYARHWYRNWYASGVNFTGNDIPSAPRTTGDIVLGWTPQDELLKGFKAELEWAYVGPYRMDDANVFTYHGHDLFGLRTVYAVNDDIDLFARATNLLDHRWATAAAISGGREEFAPGMPRTVYAGVTARF
jgi:outer membrane receptor protein involved in Fe transport